ncbi:MAG: hypothetical protein ABDI19_08645 [Armatimonadota bacterium]
MNAPHHHPSIEEALRMLPQVPAPPLERVGTSPRGWLQPLMVMWLLLLVPAAYLLQRMLDLQLAETVLQATPYPHWQALLHEAQQTLTTGLQRLLEVLG